MAITFDSRSWVYTTPCATTGVVAYPSSSPAERARPVDSTGTHHATPSLVTSELVIGLATSRVFCRLPPGSVQAAATAGLPEAPGALLAWPVAACLAKQLATLKLALVPQPTTARPTVTARDTPAAAGRHVAPPGPPIIASRSDSKN